MEYITSVQNEKIKSAVKLQSAKGRAESGAFLVEGAKLIGEAIRSGFVPLRCFSRSGAAELALPDAAERYVVTEAVLKKLSSLTTPQDHVAVIKQRDAVSHGDDGFILALDRLQDPSNLGAILRSAEAFGAKRIVLSKDSCDPFSPKSLRAAMGSTFRLSVEVCDLCAFLKAAGKNGYTVIGADLDKTANGPDILKAFPKKILVIGNEGSGISREVKELCGKYVYIPMSGVNESLNAAVAASILLWENGKTDVE